MSFASGGASTGLLAATLMVAVSGPALAQAVPAVEPQPDQASLIADLQRQINELKATVADLKAAQTAAASAAVARPEGSVALAQDASPPAALAPSPGLAQAAPVSAVASQDPLQAPPSPVRTSEPWYEKLALRGYTQMRLNKIVSGDANAPAGVSRLRSIGDSGIRDDGNFTLRRVRLVLQGDLNDYVSLYFQPDFATAVSNQSGGERREGFAQLRDAYADVFPTGDKSFRIRLGQSKVPYGWENMQSSSNRLALDRSDGINSAAPGERDLGVVAYYTPSQVQEIWDRLAADGQKLFGNYGAFGLGVFNGQGLNRTETNNNVMKVALATWPFKLDGLGLEGQVLEVGGSMMRNRINPEVRSGGISPISYADNRVGLHAILYPQPFGLQAEWNWGRGPQFDPVNQQIETRALRGGYVQAMARVRNSPVGSFYPFARWQYYRGGFKAATNAPRLETEELEVGIEFLPTSALELTVTYGWASRREADERRFGQAEGELLRIQAQWNY
ncbi:porin [Blastomonas sp.]|uniref:porin n=1 Tax=Blastomonas sp. TaxID=1909299 RepID=UPI00260EB7CC|nr:porin [Blastomonas sp.]MDM7955675.1 porin [Blastomonas sp.]